MQTDVKAVTIIALKNKSMLSVLNQAKMLPVSHPLPTGYISENTRHMSYEEWDTLTSVVYALFQPLIDLSSITEINQFHQEIDL